MRILVTIATALVLAFGTAAMAAPKGSGDIIHCSGSAVRQLIQIKLAGD